MKKNAGELWPSRDLSVRCSCKDNNAQFICVPFFKQPKPRRRLSVVACGILAKTHSTH